MAKARAIPVVRLSLCLMLTDQVISTMLPIMDGHRLNLSNCEPQNKFFLKLPGSWCFVTAIKRIQVGIREWGYQTGTGLITLLFGEYGRF